MIWNAHDSMDYSAFLGFPGADPRCDWKSLWPRIKSGEYKLVKDRVDYYGDTKSHHWNNHDHSLSRNLANLCASLANGTIPPATDPMLASAKSKKVVFQFELFGDHRFGGVTDCLYNERFRSRYHAARNNRLRHFSSPSAMRPQDELWLSVHFRAGDVAGKARAYAKKDRGNLFGLAHYLKNMKEWIASDPALLKGHARGRKLVVHFFSEGSPHAFRDFTNILPDTVLHLGNKLGTTTKHDMDLMSQSHVLIGGTSTFFQMAAHLCDACVVLSRDVARDAERIDWNIGGTWPRQYELVKVHGGKSAGEVSFDAAQFGPAFAKVVGRSLDGDGTWRSPTAGAAAPAEPTDAPTDAPTDTLADEFGTQVGDVFQGSFGDHDRQLV